MKYGKEDEILCDEISGKNDRYVHLCVRASERILVSN